MLKKILYLVEALLKLILVCASGLGLFVLISWIVYECFGPEWLRSGMASIERYAGVLPEWVSAIYGIHKGVADRSGSDFAV